MGPRYTEDYEAWLLHAAVLGPYLWWAFMKPYAIRRLVDEINLGVALYVEENRLLWEEFPTEMDILLRMRLERRAVVRTV